MLVSLSRLQHAKPDELAELREQGKSHLEFACSLARLHIEQGGRVLFEYPLTASEEPCLWKLRSIDGMRCVGCDQCQFGMTSVGSVGNVGPACKATGFMIFGGHDHIQLLSGRAKSCEKYPHGWWQRYCMLCDKACEPQNAKAQGIAVASWQC